MLTTFIFRKDTHHHKLYKRFLPTETMENKQISFPIVIMKEGAWFVASCPSLDIATQGKTEQEVRENMKELIDEYVNDKDTVKPEIDLESTSLSFVNVTLERGGTWENSSHLTQTK